ncbi:hypothetical protein D1BOALGB6SA_848 [Olavius sp. associated proteobacterium Delta 1]|nr:hypothetical protein D1BOALGB6SA_848 [Olavius sp. associated proteobacterium Delta 1]
MLVDEHLLFEFEKKLNPQNLKDSPIPAALIGFGEISAIFEIADNSRVAFKRMPLFQDHSSAKAYTNVFNEYCRLLIDAGLRLPPHQTAIIEVPGRPVTLYIAQEKLPAGRFAHQLIHELEADENQWLIESIASEISKIWCYNRDQHPALKLALDGQLSNWVWLEDRDQSAIYYIDTSTPLFRQEGIEQLDAELFLKSSPPFLRWILRRFFLADVINRYYDQRQVLIDLAANLFKEQRPDLISLAVEILNRQLVSDQVPLTIDAVKKYYREDKLVWTLFLSFRRIDRWLTTKILRRRYEFILPGNIKR